MARTKGRVGSLYVNAPNTAPQGTTYNQTNAVEIGQIRAWSLDTTVDLAEVTDMGDKWREHLQTLRGWSGEFTVFSDPSATVNQDEIWEGLLEGSFSGSLATTSGELEGQLLGLFCLDDDAAIGVRKMFFGDIILTGAGVSVEVDGVDMATFRFTGNGLLGYVTNG